METFFRSLKVQYQRYKKSEIQTHSAALAYHTILATVPVIALIFLYLKSIGISRYWFNLVRLFLLSHLNVTSDSTVIQHFDRLISPGRGHGWGWLGLILIFYSTWNLIDKFGRSLDSVLKTALDEHHIIRRGLIKLSVRRLFVMLGLPIALLLSLIAAQWIKRDSWLHVLFALQTVGPLIALPISWAVDIVVFFLVYYFTPQSSVPWSQALKAALFAGPASEVAKHLFGVYSRHAVAIHKGYGVFVVVPLFVLWVQISWMIILCGALLIRFSPKPPSLKTS